MERFYISKRTETRERRFVVTLPRQGWRGGVSILPAEDTVGDADVLRLLAQSEEVLAQTYFRFWGGEITEQRLKDYFREKGWRIEQVAPEL